MSGEYIDYTYNYQNPYAAYRPQVQQQQQGPSAGQQVAGQAARTGASAATRGIAGSLAGGGTAAAGGAAATGGAAAGGGTIVVSNMAAVPAGYTAVGSAAGGGIVAAPTATIAGTGAATTGAAGAGTAGAAAAGGSGTAGAGGVGLGTAAGATAGALAGGYGLHRLHSRSANKENMASDTATGAASGAAIGASLGSVLPGAGTVIGGAIGGIAGGLYGFGRSAFGSGKSKEERDRDYYRSMLRESGFVDDNWERKGADGQTWKVGDSNQEGRDDYNWNLEVDDQGNLINEEQRMMAGSLDPLGYLISPDKQRTREQFVGETTNAILNTGGGMQDVKDLYASMGITRESAAQELSKLLEEDKIDEGKFNAYLAAIDRTLD